MKQPGDKVGFTGGAESTPLVEVGKCPWAGNHNGEPILSIEQDGRFIVLSVQTMREILNWYDEA